MEDYFSWINFVVIFDHRKYDPAHYLIALCNVMFGIWLTQILYLYDVMTIISEKQLSVHYHIDSLYIMYNLKTPDVVDNNKI